MNKYVLLIIIAAIVLGGIFFLNNNLETKNDNSGLKVAASFYPLAYFTEQIAGDRVTVKNVTPAGVEPHDYDPTGKEIAEIQESDLLVLNGAGFEPWAEKIKDDLKKNNVIIVQTSEGLDLQKGEAHAASNAVDEEHEKDATSNVADEEGHEEELDPHVWLSPRLAKMQANNIVASLIKADEKNKSYYEANAKSLNEKFDALDQKYKTGLSSCQQKNFVTSHIAFGYLAREYELTQVAISGLSPEEEPSSKQLAEVADFAKANNVKYIFFETLISPKLAETLAQEIGAETLVLDPIEGLSDDDIKQGKNYFTVMEDNLKNLQIALQCK